MDKMQRALRFPDFNEPIDCIRVCYNTQNQEYINNIHQHISESFQQYMAIHPEINAD
jgi:hypothetical protein